MIGITVFDGQGEIVLNWGNIKTAPLNQPYLILEDMINRVALELAKSNKIHLVKKMSVVIKDAKYLPDGEFNFNFQNIF